MNIKHVSPFTFYGLGQTFNLGTSWQEFSTEFTTTGFTGRVNDGRLMFYLAPFAAAGDTYYIDIVRLEKANPPAINPPAITTQPSNQNVIFGQTATFSVVASGASLSYQWQKNGSNIPGAISASYTIPPAALSDNGSTFRVNVTNTAGSVLSNPAILTVMPSASVNLVSNPGFELGTASWLFYTNGIGTFSITSPGLTGNNSAKIALGSAGTNIQLYQRGIKLEPNTRYRLSFAAYSSTGHDMVVPVD